MGVEGNLLVQDNGVEHLDVENTIIDLTVFNAVEERLIYLNPIRMSVLFPLHKAFFHFVEQFHMFIEVQ